MKVNGLRFEAPIVTGKPGHMIKYVILIISVLILCFQIAYAPVIASGLIISPHTSKVEMLPGTTARAMLSIENGLERSYNFRFTAARLSSPPDGYAGFPDLSWLNIITGDTLLAPGERTLVTIEITIPEDKILEGQKLAFSIDVTCTGEPLYNDNAVFLVIIGQSPAQQRPPYWPIGGSIIALSAVGTVIWVRWKDSKKNEWTTGLKTRHWLK